MLNFPDSPTNGQLFVNGATTFQFDGTKWLPRITGYLPTSGGTVDGPLNLNGPTTAAALLRVNSNIAINQGVPTDNVGNGLYTANINLNAGTLGFNIYWGTTAPAGWKHLNTAPGGYVYIDPNNGNMVFASTSAGTAGAVAAMTTTLTISPAGALTTVSDMYSNAGVYLGSSGDPGSSTTWGWLGNRMWRFKQASGDEGSAGMLNYRWSDPNALAIIGAGTATGNRRVKVWDNLDVAAVLNVYGRTNHYAQVDSVWWNGGNYLQIWDDNNGRLEVAGGDFYINWNTSKKTNIGGDLYVRGYSTHNDLKSDTNVYVPNGYVYAGSYIEAGSDIRTHQSFYTQSKGDAGSSTDWGFFSSRKWRFSVNAGDDGAAGSIDYRGYDGGAMGIVGAGAAGNRNVRIYDNLWITGKTVIESAGGRSTIIGDTALEMWTGAPNRYARIRYHVDQVRTWTAGVLTDGRFGISDENAGAWRFLIGTDGWTNTGGLNVSGDTYISNWLYIRRNGGSSYFHINDDGNAHIESDGTIWINSASGGDIRTATVVPKDNNYWNVGYGGAIYWSVVASNYPGASDSRLKTDIEQHPEALPFVEALVPKTFKWREGRDTARQQHGFVAQDVREVFGEGFGGWWLSNGVQLVCHNQLTAVLWQAVRELSGTVKRLSLELETLRAGK